LDVWCADCHDGRPDLPRLDRSAAPGRELALRAALMVSAGRMPPAPAQLADGDRDGFVRDACAFAGVSADRCAMSFVPRFATDPACEPGECLRVVDAGRRASGTTVGLVRALAPPATRTYYLNPSLLVTIALLGEELCPAALGDAELTRCMRDLLDVDRLRLLPPADNPGGAR
ncbi:MAG TPA: hypothetical protein VF469_06485, partial [Kofleriaceae bacterium]